MACRVRVSAHYFTLITVFVSYTQLSKPHLLKEMLKSFIPVSEYSHFPIENLPYGAYRTGEGEIHLCSAIGAYIVDLFVLEEEGFFDGPFLKDKNVFQESTLNHFMSMGKKAWSEARNTLQKILSENHPDLQNDKALRQRVFLLQNEVEMVLPVRIGDYTDFYSSEQHARNVGSMFRDPEKALLPNWKHVPVGYHGRSSSVVISGTPLHRPCGQILPEGQSSPVFEPSKRLDFELEMGFLTGPGNTLGTSIPVHEARDHIFGFVLLNDWSARDIQKWEYQPLGPFLAKNWATSISPWVVTTEALNDHWVPALQQDPVPLDYLQHSPLEVLDIQLEVQINTAKLDHPYTLCRTNYRNMYWTPEQQLAHQTITGCNVRPGDLYGSGTISGMDRTSYGSLLELSWNGSQPISLPSGETRTFLEDGDEIIMTAFAENNGKRIGFGEVRGKILPPRS